MAGGHVRKALGELGRDDEVVDLRDGLQVGPLADVDRGAKQRDAWWQMLSAGVPAWQTFSEETSLDDFGAMGEARADPRPVVVWHGPDPAEHLVMLRTCFHFASTPEARVRGSHGRRRSAPCAALVLSLRRALRRRGDGSLATPASDPRCSCARGAGNESSRIPAALRDLRQAASSFSLSMCTMRGLRAACVDWTGSTRVLGLVLADLPVGDLFLIWRVRRLLEAGLLEGRGTNEKLGLPGELRSGG
ncbi:MAG: DUF1835 domain-containing protein [Myxococcales bacterium]|nr:DUF1835 domain-containing protein [Myxococcales bacterium]